MTSLRREKEEKVTRGSRELSRGRIISLRDLYKVRLADAVISYNPAHVSPRWEGTNIYARDLRGAMYACDIPGYV